MANKEHAKKIKEYKGLYSHESKGCPMWQNVLDFERILKENN